MILGTQSDSLVNNLHLLMRSPFMIDAQMRKLANTNQCLVPASTSVQQELPLLKRGSRGAAVKELQRMLNRLGVKPLLPQTGYFGDMTSSAVMSFQTQHRIKPVDGEVGPKTWSMIESTLGEPYQQALKSAAPGAYSEILAVVAQGQVGFVEESNNQGKDIDKYWGATNYPNGYINREPWCAAFVCWCMSEATQLASLNCELPNSARAYDFDEKWAKSQGNLVRVTEKPAASEIGVGDILVYTFSHVGIAVGESDSGRITTVEGNTNAAGSREGDGVYQKSRATKIIRSAIKIL